MLTKVFSNSALYSLSSILLRASSIFFFPIFSYYLTKADYGILSITQSITVVITSLAGIELHRALTRFLHDDRNKDNEEFKKKLIGNILLTNIITTSVMVGIFLLFGSFFLKNILNDIPFYPYMTYSLLGILFNFIVNLYRVYLKATHKGKASFAFDMSFYGANILLNLFFVVALKTDVIGIIYSTVICGIIFSFISMYNLVKKTTFSLDKNIIKPVFRYSLPLIPFIWLGLGVEMSSTFFLNAEQGKEISGTFYIAITFAGVFVSIKESVLSAITPWFFEHYESKKEMINKFIIHLIIGGGILCFSISIFSYEILSILSSKKDFIEAWKYVPLLITGYMLVFIGQLINLPIYFEKTKTQYLILSNIGGFVTTFILAYIMTKPYGIDGAVSSKTAGYFIMTVISIIISWKVSKFKVNIPILTIVMLITCSLSYINFLNLDYFYLLSFKLVLISVSTVLYISLLVKNYPTVANFISSITRSRKN